MLPLLLTHLLPYNKRQESHQRSQTCVHTQRTYFCAKRPLSVKLSAPKTFWLYALACKLSHSVVSDSLWPHGLAHQTPLKWHFPGKNTGVGCHALLQRIFSSQGSNLHLLHWQAGSLSLSHLLSACSKTHLNRFSFKMWWGPTYTAGINKLRWNLMYENP